MNNLLSKIRLTTAAESAAIDAARKPAPVTPAALTTTDQATARSIADRAARTRGLAGTIKRALEPSRTTRKSWNVTDPRAQAAIRTQVYFDVMAAHTITPLDLHKLSTLEGRAFTREILGIMQHLDRQTATFTNGYTPATARTRHDGEHDHHPRT